MSTSGAAGRGAAAPGDFAASQAGTDAAAQSAAAAEAAGDLGGQGAAVASAGDAAMAAAEAADTVRFGLCRVVELLLPPDTRSQYVQIARSEHEQAINVYQAFDFVVVDAFITCQIKLLIRVSYCCVA